MHILSRIKTALFRRIFYVCNVKRFKHFSYTATIDNPSRVEGHKYISIESYAYVQSSSWLLTLERDNIKPSLDIKKGATIGRFSHIVALRKVVIGENVLIAEKVYISDNMHEYRDITKPIVAQPIVHKGNVCIGKNSWIGENVAIIGVSIGTHCVIGANSVVTQDIPDYSVAVGSPAKVIKRYNFDNNEWENIE